MARTPPHARRERLGRCRLDGLPYGLQSRARELARLRDALAATLGREERMHFTGVSATIRKLVIFADSSAWCSRLRYHAPRFEETAQALTGIRPQVIFKVQLPVFRERDKPRRPLSDQAVRSLESAARSVDDEALATALRRLAGRDA